MGSFSPLERKAEAAISAGVGEAEVWGGDGVGMPVGLMPSAPGQVRSMTLLKEARASFLHGYTVKSPCGHVSVTFLLL